LPGHERGRSVAHRVAEVHQLDPDGRVGKRAGGHDPLARGRDLGALGSEGRVIATRVLDQLFDIRAERRSGRRGRDRCVAGGECEGAGQGEAERGESRRASTAPVLPESRRREGHDEGGRERDLWWMQRISG